MKNYSLRVYRSIDKRLLFNAQKTPNCFTPDGDDFNQTWRIYTVGIDVYDFNLTIFNRWGQIIWESNNIEIGWDGTYAGIPVVDGIFTWVVNARVESSYKRSVFKGFITLIR